LDAGTAAICRARDRAMNLLTNDPQWSNVASSDTVQIQEPEFFGPGIDDALPAPTCASSATPDANDSKAAFIKVTTVTRQVAPTILVAVGAISPQSTWATATAGTTYVACNVQPLMLCNPNEPNPFTAIAGDLFGFTATGNTGGFSPGDFSLLDPAGQTHSGAGDIRNLLAASNPDFCYVDSVSPAQGQKTVDVASGINVRFDINPTGNPQGIDQTPASNVIKGDDTNSCWQSQNVGNKINLANAMPGNLNMTQVGSAWMGGTWDTNGAASYWKAHHDSTGATGWPTVNGSPATRYQVYQMENAGSTSWAGSSSENNPPTAPSCNPQSQAPSADRRIISVAIVDCLAQGVQGNKVANVRSKEYADFFLTQPVGSGNIIWAEFIRFMTPNSPGSKLHQIVQLYR
jgi:hypothetical protein